jgi:hypothetical protein
LQDRDPQGRTNVDHVNQDSLPYKTRCLNRAEPTSKAWS